VHHGAGLGVGLVNLQMQQQFAGARTVAGQNVAVQVREADVGRLQVALAQHGGRAEHIARAQADADVAAVAVHILPLPQLAAHANDLGAQGLASKELATAKGDATAGATPLTCSGIGTAVCCMASPHAWAE
jgi:hypothetical protein